MKIIFVRHGQSEANRDGIIADSTSPLTEKGIEQALHTGSLLVDLDIKTVVCSEYTRAVQTAEQISKVIKFPIEDILKISELNERSLGIVEGQPKMNESNWFYEEHSDVDGMESLNDLENRMKHALKLIVEKAAGKTLLVVGHSISGFYLEKAIRDDTEDDVKLDSELKNAEFKVFEIETL